MRSYPFILLASLVAASALHAADSEPAPAPVSETLAAGSTVKIESLAAAKWLQGAPPTEWKKGDVYLMECWATWCGPCIQAIPHMDALYRKYGDRGLHVYGMNVLDRDETTAAKFVAKKGDAMSYPVAYVEKGAGAFEKEWMVPAHVQGIPFTFVVAEGKILMTPHPMLLTDEVIEDLLAGGDRRDKSVAKLSAGNKEVSDRSAAGAALGKALEAKDIPAAEARLAEYEKLDQSGGRDAQPQLARVEIALMKGDDDSFQKALDVVTVPWALPAVVTSHEIRGDNFSPERMKAIVARIEAITPGQKDLQGQLTLASLDWKLGNKDAAKALIQQGIDMPESVVGEPLKRLRAKMEAGEFPPMKDILDDIRASYKDGGGH